MNLTENFTQWLAMGEALLAYIETALYLEHDRHLALIEGRKDPSKLRNATTGSPQRSLFDTPEDDAAQAAKYGRRPEFDSCPVTPLSSYDKEISVIQKYAMSSPTNFAQVMLFSPLSANVSFAKHWDNFPVVMTVLRHFFPNGVPKPEDLKKVISAFSEKYSTVGATVSGWKYDTILYVWNNKEKLWQSVRQAAKSGDDVDLLSALIQIPGVAPVKAGFMAQLIFGRSGCLDTHNIDIYSKAWPDLAKDLNPDDWGKSGKKGSQGELVSLNKRTIDGLKKYTSTIEKFKQRGIGTRELWDVWVDFVGFMYKSIIDGGHGLYADLEPALNPNDPKYQGLKTDINKMKITATGKKLNGIVPVPTITGHGSGGGAGATHTIAAKDPFDALRAFKAQQDGSNVPDWAKAVKRDIDPKTGRPFNKIMHATPAMLRYFGPALSDGGEVDVDRVKDIIQRRIANYDVGVHSKEEERALKHLQDMIATNTGLFKSYSDDEIALAAQELDQLRQKGADMERGSKAFAL